MDTAAIQRRLIALGAGLTGLFALDTLLVLLLPPTPADVSITRSVQALPLQPLAPLLAAVDWTEGLRQVLLAVATVALVTALNRRAFRFAVACALSGPPYWLIQELVHRPRPSAELIHVVRHTGSFSYPSGHEVFFTWFSALLVLALLRVHLPRWQAAGWLLAALLLTVVALSRVYLGEHWSSDVLGGLLLGGGWTALALGVRAIGGPLLAPRAAG